MGIAFVRVCCATSRLCPSPGLPIRELCEDRSDPRVVVAGAMVKKSHRLQQKTSKTSTVQDRSRKDRLVKLVKTKPPKCNCVNLQAPSGRKITPG